MKKVLFVLSVIACLVSCSRRELSVYDLQQKSLNSGKHIDTIFNDLVFNCSDSMVYRCLGINIGDKYTFPIKELEPYTFDVTPHFFNDSLYEIDFNLPDQYYRFSDIENVYKLKYGDPDTIIKSNVVKTNCVESYWFNSNLQIKVSSRESELFNSVSILYTDLSRKTIGPEIVSDDINYFNLWTKKYYDTVYLPKKKKNLKGI